MPPPYGQTRIAHNNAATDGRWYLRNTAVEPPIVIESTTICGERGQYYRVQFEGAVLIKDTWNPEF